MSNSREFYRIVYDVGPHPLLECRQGKFNVIDISESGIRFTTASEKVPRFAVNDLVEGKIVFPEKRGSVPIKGIVLRVGVRDVAINLQEGGLIPLARIMEEQRILIQKGRLSS